MILISKTLKISHILKDLADLECFAFLFLKNCMTKSTIFFPPESGCQDSPSYLCCQSYPTNLVFVLLATKVTIVRFPYNVVGSSH